jgi:hypothetical protein
VADLTQLNADTLKKFNDNDVADFITDLNNIRHDDPNGGMALKSLIEGRETAANPSANSFLTIGGMTSDDTVFGSSLLKALTGAASAVDGVFTTQQTLFGDIHTDLGTVISTLLNTQGSNLGSIDGQKFLDPFTTVDGDLSGANSSSTAGS